jgi:hypothetical protein
VLLAIGLAHIYIYSAVSLLSTYDSSIVRDFGNDTSYLLVTCLFAGGPLNVPDEQLHMAFAIITCILEIRSAAPFW